MNISIRKCSHSSQVNFRVNSTFVHGLKRSPSSLLVVLLSLRLFLHSALDLQALFLTRWKDVHCKLMVIRGLFEDPYPGMLHFFANTKDFLGCLGLVLVSFEGDNSGEWGECQVVCTSDFINQFLLHVRT